MVNTKKNFTMLVLSILKVFNIFFKKIPIYVITRIIYWITRENDEVDGILSKRKYRRIKQSFRYKIWFWENI